MNVLQNPFQNNIQTKLLTFFFILFRTKEKIGYRPRTVKFHQLLSVNYHKKRNGGRQFTVRVTNGRTYELSASKRLLASQWVQSLLQLLPAENVAALKVQANWRARVQFKKFNKIIKEKEELKKQQLKDIKNKKANEQAAARSNRLNRLKKVKAEREAQQKLANAKLAESGETKSKEEKEKKPKLSRMARLKAAKAAKAQRMEEKKKAKEDADQKAKEASEAAAKAMNEENNETPTHFWTEYETEEGKYKYKI